MSAFTQHAKIIIKMYNNKMPREFIKKYSITDIIKSCERIEKSEIMNEDYMYNVVIQEELIKDEKFIAYLKILNEKKMNMNGLINLLEELKLYDEKCTDYSIKDIINVLSNKDLFYDSYYDYLKYFSKESIFFRKIITQNLNYFEKQDKIKLSNLTEKERELFKLNYLDNCNLFPLNQLKEIYEILVNNEELQKLLDVFYIRKLYIPLYIDDYQKINKNTKEKREYIESIANKINNNDITYQMLLNWLKNDCNTYDLKIINEKIDTVDLETLKNIFYNRTSYINFIYGNKLKKLPLDDIYGRKEDIIIYAIRENKRNFLRVIEENMGEFLSIPSDSILFYKKIYTKYINLNELTCKHLSKFKTMECNSYLYLDELKEQVYTFEEINTLYNSEKKYIQLYNELLDLKVDDRLLRIRQLLNKKLLCNIKEGAEIKNIAQRIKEKPLYAWIENDFCKIDNLTVEDAIQVFLHYEFVKKFIYDVKNRNELSYILRNTEKLMNYNTLESIKADIENIDEDWIKLKNEIEFSEEFLQKYSDNIKDFLLNNGAELAYTYFIKRNEEQREAFKLIVKAQIMGKFKQLKYHKDDLKQEIDYELKDYQIKEWTEENRAISDGIYNIKEYDDFYHTMILGEFPKSTCLSYRGGAYNACLLACFDSNKKILYAKVNDKIVARAMVRLTKGTYNRKSLKLLSFVDVENNSIGNKVDCEEKLTLFLERPYISGVSDSEAIKIKKLFIKLLKTKANQMDALLVLSSNYNNAIDHEFLLTRYYMYISKSKSSSQYLDSLSGQATIVDEGQYKANDFLIWRQGENEEDIFESSIFS